MKAIILSAIIISLMIGAPSAQSVLAKKHHLTDTEQEDSDVCVKAGRSADDYNIQADANTP